MAAKLLEGEPAARELLERLRPDIGRLAAAGRPPRLVAIRANRDPGTAWYARAQSRLCAAAGVRHAVDDLGPDASAAAIAAAIRRHNDDPETSGVMLFMPLPRDVDAAPLYEEISPRKDAEGMHPANLGRLLSGRQDGPLPCTAAAAVDLVALARPDLAGAKALVIGRSAIVGKPAALLLLSRHATVTIAHTRSDVRAAALEAEVIIAAAGASGAAWRRYEAKRDAAAAAGRTLPPPPCLRPLVAADMVRRGAVVVDVGENEIPAAVAPDGRPFPGAGGKPDLRRAGDVDFEQVSEVAGWITAPRGGVGPLTNAHLIANVVRAGLRLLADG